MADRFSYFEYRQFGDFERNGQSRSNHDIFDGMPKKCLYILNKISQTILNYNLCRFQNFFQLCSINNSMFTMLNLSLANSWVV